MDFFKRLFGKKDTQPTRPQSPDSAITAPLSEAQIQSIRATSIRPEPAQLLVGAGQSVGKQRELNEDSLLTLTATIAGNAGSQPFGLYIIADGMGGHQYGEVASNAAIRVISGYIMKKFHDYLFNPSGAFLTESLQEIMQDAISEAQRVVLREAPGSGTTLTAALVFGQQVTIGHVGDSRAYFFYRDGRTEVVTRDHSLVKRLEELGQITSSEAAVHPQRNVLYRALGQGEALEADITTVPFPPGGYMLLCSDGLWGVVNEDTIKRLIFDGPTLEVSCQNLVNAANAAGGPDNISAILVQLYI